MKVFLWRLPWATFMHLSSLTNIILLLYFIFLLWWFSNLLPKDTKDPRLNPPLNTNLLIATDPNKEYESYGRGVSKIIAPKSCVHFKSQRFFISYNDERVSCKVVSSKRSHAIRSCISQVLRIPGVLREHLLWQMILYPFSKAFDRKRHLRK